MTEHPRQLTVPVLGAPTRAWQYGEGDAAPLLLVHGFRGDHHGLELIAEGLTVMLPGVPIIVPDLPGFGMSSAIPGREHDLALYGEWLRAFVSAVDQHAGNVEHDRQVEHAAGMDNAGTHPSGVHIVGHSFGSLVVARAIADGLAPGSITFINPISSPALSGPNAFMTRLAIAYYRAAEALPPAAARALLGNPAIVRVMSEVMAKTRDSELRSWIHGQHDQYFSVFSDPTTLLQAFRASVSHTVAEIVAESRSDSPNGTPFSVPTLIIAGDRDDISPLRAQLDLQRCLPGAELRVIPGVGHLVHYEAPEDAAVHVVRFLRTITQSTSPTAKNSSATGESR